MISSIRFKINFVFLSIAMVFISCQPQEKKEDVAMPPERKIAIVIHGGAGTIKRENMDSVSEAAYRERLNAALDTAYAILESEGESCEAIMAAITLMENSPLFNAGRGAVFTSSGENELDASIMRGDDLNAGAVAGVKTIKNPILAAYEVMTQSPHVMLVSGGAEEFATQQGLDIVNPDYFKTEKRAGQLEKIKRMEKEHGTVGAVAVDKNGNICAATSTGGMTNKKWGRVGDAPIIGAGTYANNNTCGFSGTGHGEFYIRTAAAHDVSALMEYKGLSVVEATQAVMDKIGDMGATGGMIALDKYGNIAMPFNSAGMFRGYKKEGENGVVKIFGDE
ncbi:MAG: beta-aspartyl-peptidase [Flammeovirgaceae bacterium]|nr:beta-aspartyl-peptidase [Flammeovirgaceae bacterium]MBR06199.1 beta-aspartyl-peptidase [Rickettsiales bacterium]HCX24318.1 beta-aspartyl-peptidase [Cytophagales bacterium]|tara:strand:- start:71 stop:1078 length:1008 start_codon:yes stop_codon:yes gene_type:complete